MIGLLLYLLVGFVSALVIVWNTKKKYDIWLTRNEKIVVVILTTIFGYVAFGYMIADLFFFPKDYYNK